MFSSFLFSGPQGHVQATFAYANTGLAFGNGCLGVIQRGPTRNSTNSFDRQELSNDYKYARNQYSK